MDGWMKVAEGVVKKEGEGDGAEERWGRYRGAGGTHVEMLSWAAVWQNESR